MALNRGRLSSHSPIRRGTINACIIFACVAPLSTSFVIPSYSSICGVNTPSRAPSEGAWQRGDSTPAVMLHAATDNHRSVPYVAQNHQEMPHGELRSPDTPPLSRRNLLRVSWWATAGVYCGSRTIDSASAYRVHKVEPDEKETYAVAQKGTGPLRVLWVGSGDMKGVFKNLFLAGNEVVAVDLITPDAQDVSAATTYATEHGFRLRFEEGDATKLHFADGTFDVVVSSMFLCQDFDPEVVVSEIRRVLKPRGRFGFYEHVEDIGTVIVDKVFGDRSVIRVQADPELINIVAGVVRKV